MPGGRRQILFDTFGEVPFIADLPYPLLQFEVCRVLHKKHFEDGAVIYEAVRAGTSSPRKTCRPWPC